MRRRAISPPALLDASPSTFVPPKSIPIRTRSVIILVPSCLAPLLLGMPTPWHSLCLSFPKGICFCLCLSTYHLPLITYHSTRQPPQRIRQKPRLHHRLHLRHAMIESLALTKLRRKRPRPNPSIVIPRVSRHNLHSRPLHQQPIRLAPLRLVVNPHSLIHRQAIVDRVLTHKVPVAHPRRADASNVSVVRKRPRRGELFGHSIRKRIRLRNRQQRRTRPHRIQNLRRQFSKLRRRHHRPHHTRRLRLQPGPIPHILRLLRRRRNPRRDNHVVVLTRLELLRSRADQR